MRRTVAIGEDFDAAGFVRAFAAFRSLYHVRPERILCAPGVLQRYAAVFARSSDAALGGDLRYEGVPLAGAILAPGVVVFEGDVDEERMGDW